MSRRQAILGNRALQSLSGSNSFEQSANVTVCLLTSVHRDTPLVRVTLVAEQANGLQADSQIMVDKIMTLRVAKVSCVIETASDPILEELDAKLSFYLGLTKS